MFHILWIVLWSVVLVPLGAAFLRGWTPRWSRGSSRRTTRARGFSALLLYAGSLTPAVLGCAGVPEDGLLPLRIAAGPLLILVALTLSAWASLTDRPSRTPASPRPPV